MSNKQFFAQIAVFALLAGNIAAYYFFWPSQDGRVAREGKILAPEKSTLREKGQKSAAKTTAPLFAVSSPLPGFPEIIEPAAAQKNTAEDDSVNQLLKEIQRQATGTSSAAVTPPSLGQAESSPMFNRKNEDKAPLARVSANEVKEDAISPVVPKPPENPAKSDYRVTLPLNDPVGTADKKNANFGLPSALPPLKAEPLPAPGATPQPTRSPGLVATGLSAAPGAKAQQSPWRVNMEVVGTRTQLTAQVWPKGAGPVAEFKILCDRVEMQEVQNSVQATGKVTFVGAGLKGSCQKLTLPFDDIQILFEESVEIADDAPQAFGADEKQGALRAGSLLRGQRIVWRPSFPPLSRPALP